MNPRLSFMLEIIRKIGDFQRAHFRTEIVFEEKKGVMDIVSFVDKESEQMFREAVLEKFPTDAIMGEESYNPNYNYGQHEKLWIVDPLDGTLMYQRSIPFYAPMIAYIENGIVQCSSIFFPEQNTLYYADKDGAFCDKKQIQVSTTRELNKSVINVSFKTLMKEFEYRKLENMNKIIGRIVDMSPAAQKLAMCMNGQADGGMSFDGGCWDTVPGGYLIQQAGGKVTNLGSDSWDIFNPHVIFSNGLIHDEFQKLIES